MTRIPILDIHAHFPMQLRTPPRELQNDLRNRLLFKAVKGLLNDEHGKSRVRLPAARDLNVSFGSVLYNPADEFCGPDGPFQNVLAQIDLVEAALGRFRGQFAIVRDPDALEQAILATNSGGPQAVFHTIEAGLGVEDPSHIPDLAAAGVAYITLAHLLFRGVSPSVNAFPCLTDDLYRLTFYQPEGGLTTLGGDMLDAMLAHGIVPDITHMTVDALNEVLDVAGRAGMPVMYSHGGVREISDYDYNLSRETIQKIAACDGVFGVIFSDHWLMPAPGAPHRPPPDIGRVIDVINAVRNYANEDCIAIGSDFDGFIKPVDGLEDYDKFDNLRAALLANYDASFVEKILWRNAVRTLKLGWGHGRGVARRLSSTVAAPVPTAAGPTVAVERFSPARVIQAKDVADVQRIVKNARDTGRKVRVVGAEHSAPDAIFSHDKKDLRVLLRGDELRHRRVIDQALGLVSVGGGCYLGVNPLDPDSTPATSLDVFLDEHGLALPILGGISHQTIAGFMQTGSSGGSTRHAFASAIEEIELVNGLGEVVTFARGTDGWKAAGVAMGLLGVVTRVTLRAEPRYFVTGAETNHEEADSLLAKDAQGNYPLEAALTSYDYLHLNWFPQKFVRRVGQWVGRRGAVVADPDPYESELNTPLKNALAAIVLALADGALQIDPDGDAAQTIVGTLLKEFVTLDHNEPFNDAWHRVLPGDDQVAVDTLIQIIFTEIWIPIDKLTDTLDRLQYLLKDPSVAGNFAVELYGAAASPFWLSPSNGGSVIRVDVFWWAHNIGDPRKHFAKYWEALLEIDGTRFHWGKHLPDIGTQYGSVVFGPDLLRGRYEHMDEWLEVRAAMDPDGVFLTDYWRAILGIA